MTWKAFLTETERADFECAVKDRDSAQAALTAMRRTLQSRCQSRMRTAQARFKRAEAALQDKKNPPAEKATGKNGH